MYFNALSVDAAEHCLAVLDGFVFLVVGTVGMSSSTPGHRVLGMGQGKAHPVGVGWMGCLVGSGCTFNYLETGRTVRPVQR